ncbi:unnamed protein product [Danaus chrysippus]|uniref:(African queen) hypothetical protein n=1 Tax=Danaus chrysippus TaxID=151541 RepID=A0A8J2QZX0_9NEOP|nr:unnamed protein product [Danaus chrysippus]
MEIEQDVIRQRRSGGRLRTDGKEVDDRSNKGVKQRFEVKKKSLSSDTLQKTLGGIEILQWIEIIKMKNNTWRRIDDIQDNALVRRGKPRTHLVYGVPLTVN